MLLTSVILFGCEPEEIETDISSNAPNQVLFLKVDYTTNAFLGGTILEFYRQTESFSVTSEYVALGDGNYSLMLIYKELEKLVFSGTINWAGVGSMTFPEKLEPVSRFRIDHLKTYVLPKRGFENLFNLNVSKFNYEVPWSAVQQLMKVREFLAENPDQRVKLFLYTPTVVEDGDLKDWCWIFFLKN